MTKPTTLISLSGGIDSTYYLWKWLTENKTETILVHHCEYFSYGPQRGTYEQLAVGKIIAWLKENKLTNFHYVQTRWGGIPYPYHDIVGTSVPAGLVCASYPDVHTVLLPYWYPEIQKVNHLLVDGEVPDIHPMPDHRFWKARNVFMALAGNRKARTIKHHIRYHNKQKHEIIAEMPESLLALTWFCRRPKDGKICRTCESCTNIIPSLTKANRLHVFH